MLRVVDSINVHLIQICSVLGPCGACKKMQTWDFRLDPRLPGPASMQCVFCGHSELMSQDKGLAV